MCLNYYILCVSLISRIKPSTLQARIGLSVTILKGPPPLLFRLIFNIPVNPTQPSLIQFFLPYWFHRICHNQMANDVSCKESFKQTLCLMMIKN